MILPRPALVVLFGALPGTASPCAAQTLPRLGLSGPEVGMDLSAKPLRERRTGRADADAVIHQPRGAGRSRTLAQGDPEAIAPNRIPPGQGVPAAAEAEEEGDAPVDPRPPSVPPRSAQAEP
ncbi:hypothetical protein [Methylobacterium sp. Leaf118]|uniref:hypothetical protein n=1 Tax=Methylobacterium sp. Leaf118 TaxID=2876562 RepID=UPI001E31182B|nr:hypothetical protein [Methylobacterium sp. Leaf118]